MAAVVEVEGLTRRFGNLAAVDHVSFAVRQGETFGFLGPNGAGKTTTVRMLTGVIEPTEGTATIQGHDIRREPLLSREHIAVVPEEANVYPDLTAWQNLMLMAELYGVPRRKRVQEGKRLLGKLGLADRRTQKARALSKGLRQRLMLCSALICQPEILFLDEPTGGLDVQSARLIRRIIADMKGPNLTVFLTTHNMSEAERMCDRLAIIHKGRIAAIDSPVRLRDVSQSAQYVEVVFEGRAPALAELESLPRVGQVERTGEGYRLYTVRPGEVATELARLANRAGAQVKHLCTQKPSLEDVFLQLTASHSEGSTQ